VRDAPSHEAKRRKVLRDWYITRGKKKILGCIEQHARELGVRFTAAKIVDNRYRWGPCTVRKFISQAAWRAVNDNVNFDWRRINARMFAHRLFIVHELAHLR
jgi:predicted metal-dependent hydrolase